MSRAGKVTETESRSVLTRAWGWPGDGNKLPALGFSFGVIRLCWNQMEVMVTQYCECSKYHWIIHSKMVCFI